MGTESLLDKLKVATTKNKTSWTSAYLKTGSRFVQNEEVVKQLAHIAPPDPKKFAASEAQILQDAQLQYQLFKVYLPNITSIFQNIGMFGSEVGTFLLDDLSAPQAFATKAGGTVLVLTTLAATEPLETRNSTAKTRAVDIMSTRMIPVLREMDKVLRDSDLVFYGVCFTYGSRSNSDESSMKWPEPEMLAVIVPRDVLHQFVEGQITDNDLLAKCEMYLSDRDARFNLQRVQLRRD